MSDFNLKSFQNDTVKIFVSLCVCAIVTAVENNCSEVSSAIHPNVEIELTGLFWPLGSHSTISCGQAVAF